MKPINKILLIWAMLFLSVIQAITGTLSFGTDLLIQYLKAQYEKNNNQSGLKYKIVATIFNIILIGLPYITKMVGKLIRKLSDKITIYIEELKK